MDNPGASLPDTATIYVAGAPSSTNKYTDVFCYDIFGNFFVVKKYNTSYFVEPYILENGNYVSYTATNSVGSDVKAIAVDSIGRYLYVYEGGIKVKKYTWSDNIADNFHNATSSSPAEFTVTVPSDEITALAANKDGFFVALKNTSGSPHNITVKKYNTNGIQQGTAVNINADENEEITDMQVRDSTLFAISRYKKDEWNSDSSKTVKSWFIGKLFKLGSTTVNLTQTKIWEGSVPSDGYGLYRFVAIKPKKLVIACDGGYGDRTKTPVCSQKNKVLIFNLQGQLEQEIDASAEFSCNLFLQSGSSDFSWE